MIAQRRYLGLVCGGATLLAAAPLSVIFDRWTWWAQAAVTVAVIAAVATAARWLRAPGWVQMLAMLVALLEVLTLRFPSGGELFGLVPTPETIAWFGSLLGDSGAEMRALSIPVPDRPGLLFLVSAGLGLVAIAVDVATVVLRRPALAGLPMLAVYSVPVAVSNDAVPAVPFMIGAVGFLWLLVADNVDRVRRFGRRFTGDGRNVDIWEPSPLAAAGRRLAVVGVLLAVAVPFAVPGMTAGVFDSVGSGGAGSGAGRGTGPITSVDLFAQLNGQLRQPETKELLKVTTDDPRPYYLRFAVADQLAGEGFRNRPPSGAPVTRGLPDPRDKAPDGVTHRSFRAQVEVTDRLDLPMLPVYAVPVRTEGLDSTWSYSPEAQAIYSNRSRSAGRKYSFEYVRAEYTQEALRAAAGPTGNDPARIELTEVPTIDSVTALVNRLTADAGDTDYDRVRAIHRYFSAENGFTYDLKTSPGNSGRQIVDFLRNKKGYCEQYATAMAWLARTAGVPARVAFGFAYGNGRVGNSYSLTNQNLHAWTEVYFDNLGWVPFDATPAAGVPGSVTSEWAPDPNQTPGPSPTAGPTGGPAGTAQATALPRIERENQGAGPAGVVPGAAADAQWPRWLVGAFGLLLAALTVPGLRRRQLRRRRRIRPLAVVRTAPPDPAGIAPGVARVVRTDADAAARGRADAHAAWAELLDLMIDYRVEVNPAETPRVTADRLARDAELGSVPGGGARLLSRAEERARYARTPLGGEDLSAALRAVQRALAAHASRRVRLVAVLLPPSVLLRWSAALLDAGSRIVLAAGRWQDAALRLIPRGFRTTGRAAR